MYGYIFIEPCLIYYLVFVGRCFACLTLQLILLLFCCLQESISHKVDQALSSRSCYTQLVSNSQLYFYPASGFASTQDSHQLTSFEIGFIKEEICIYTHQNLNYILIIKFFGRQFSKLIIIYYYPIFLLPKFSSILYILLIQLYQRLQTVFKA